MNDSESAAMWKLYAQTNEAIAIQSTYSLLHSLAPNKTHVGIVNYIDYNTEWMPENNLMYPYVHKRKSFAHERELRAVIYGPPFKPDGSRGLDRKAVNPERGRLVPIVLESLIQNIYVAPTCPKWFRELVERVVVKYGLSVPVTSSAMDLTPTF